MKPAIFIIIVFALFAAGDICAGDEYTGESVLPVFPGWKMDGRPQIYLPENLFEYIDGAADAYIVFGFQELITAAYNTKIGYSITIDIYRHDTARNAFGIYSREKPTAGKFLRLGMEGYYAKGLLNVVSDNYYIKLASFGFGRGDEVFLASAARAALSRLKASSDTLKALLCFPVEGRIPHSERYAAKRFLGHEFLHSAFIADYEEEGGKKESSRFRLFIIEAENEENAARMLKDYISFVEKEKKRVNNQNGVYLLEDPGIAPQFAVLQMKGRYIWGAIGPKRMKHTRYLWDMKKLLHEKELIE